MKNVFALFSFLFSLNANNILAQTPELVKDINASLISPSVYEADFKVINGFLYFNARDNGGDAFWKTDGSTVTRVFSNFINESFTVNNMTYYSSSEDNPATGNELWKTDGTTQGTSLVADIFAGAAGSLPANFVFTNGSGFFQAQTLEAGRELWKSNGSATEMVADIFPGKNSSIDDDNTFMISLGNNILFAADNGATGSELFISDGTSAGTVLLKDISGDSSDSHFRSPVVFNNAVYLFAGTGNYDLRLWKSDGTTSGTVEIKDFNPGTSFEQLMEMVVLNNQLMIVAQGAGTGVELWTSDGTTSGTVLLKDINPGSASSFDLDDPRFLTALNDHVYFTASNGVNGFQPWVSDGTSAGTHLIATINTAPTIDKSYLFALLNETEFIIQGDDNLWKSDGTEAGTTSLAAALPANTDLEGGTSFNNKVYFSLDDEIWSTDGTIEGTQPLGMDHDGTADSDPEYFVEVANNKFVFTAGTPEHGIELWVTDGTTSGTSLLKDLTPGPLSNEILFSSESVNGKAFFTIGHDLGVTDGTPAGTIILNNEIAISHINTASVQGNGILYYVINEGGDEEKLWRTDGTVSGTYSISPAELNHNVEQLVFLNNKIYFVGNDNAHGEELWESDGTLAGSKRFIDLYPGVGSSHPDGLFVHNGKLYFKAAPNGSSDKKLYVSNGSLGGTTILKNNQVIPSGSFKALGGYVYFAGTNNANGIELWRTDGTQAGTSLFADLKPGPADFSPVLFYGASNLLYFEADEYEFWRTDGTVAGTLMLQSFSEYPDFDHFVEIDGVIYFDGFNNVWRSNGTFCHTQNLNFTPFISNSPEVLGAMSEALFFSQNSLDFGIELFKLNETTISSVETCNSLDDDCDGLIDEEGFEAIITPQGTITECKGTLVNLTCENAGDDLSYQWRKDGIEIPGATNQSYSDDEEEGSYDVMLFSLFGCTDISDATTVNRKAKPKAKITPLGSVDICSTGSVALQASSGNNYSYQWKKNGTNISGATNQVYTATSTGDYKVKVTSNFGCTKTSKATVVYSSCRLNSENKQDYLFIYPNPSASVIRVESLSADTEYQITNSIGQILTEGHTGAENTIDVSALAFGIYFLHLTKEDESVSLKFVKE